MSHGNATEREIDQLFDIIRNLQARGIGMVVHIPPHGGTKPHSVERATVLRDGKYIRNCLHEGYHPDKLENMIVGRPLRRQVPEA